MDGKISQPAPRSLRERPDLFVDATQIVPDLVLDIRYFSPDNFVGAPVEGYSAPRGLLTLPAAEALARVAEVARRDGFLLKAFDCYRPARAVAHFKRWAENEADTRTKPDYYPLYTKPELFEQGYIASQSGHSRGSTLDMTLVDAQDGQDLEMGTPFDLFSPLSWGTSLEVSEKAQANRKRLARMMMDQGFEPFAMEWWHFTLKGEPFPETYFDFPIE